MQVGTVARLFRYPVKSMRGEEIAATTVGLHGLPGDRRWAFVQSGDRSVFPWYTARQSARLLLYRPHYAAEPAAIREPPLTVETPNGQRLPIDGPELRAELEALAGAPLYLLHSYRGSPDVAPISIFNLTLAERVGERAGVPLDPRRFRANIYMQPADSGLSDADLVGRTLAIGAELRVAVVSEDERCKMISLDPDTAESEARVQQTVVKEFRNCAGVYGVVLRPGEVAVGDPIVVV